jgi:hypothetical protein
VTTYAQERLKDRLRWRAVERLRRDLYMYGYDHAEVRLILGGDFGTSSIDVVALTKALKAGGLEPPGKVTLL